MTKLALWQADAANRPKAASTNQSPHKNQDATGKDDSIQQSLRTNLEVLLHVGIHSTAKEAQLLSLSAILALTKVAGNSLRPFLPELFQCLLEVLHWDGLL